VDDYVVLIDGLIAGRIIKKTLSFQRVTWFWSMYGPYYPSPTGCSGEEETLEKAKGAFKVCFGNGMHGRWSGPARRRGMERTDEREGRRLS
jgi:hypothetical protein